MLLVDIARGLSAALVPLRFSSPVSHVYNPLIYAERGYAEYVKRYGQGTREVLFLGMNPGPFGMTQTGVPFGEVTAVRDWLGIDVPIGKPPREHPKRPVEGFACKRSEVSGARLWGWARATFGAPERFFARFLVVNYCPLIFMEESGKNLTPDKLAAAEREALYRACDAALRETVGALRPRWVIGVGGFAEARAQAALGGIDVKVGRILHPSPASPLANRDWGGAATRELEAQGVALQES